MPRRRLLLVAAALCLAWPGCGGSESPTGPSRSLSQTARAHLEQILGYMQERSLRRFDIDWNDFRAKVFAEAGAAQTIPDLYPTIRRALTLLGDGHSWYQPVSGETIFATTRTCGAPAIGPPSLPATIGYVRVQSFSGSGGEATGYATALQQAIREADRDDLAGWIVDLRGNGGGNMWPMIAGVGPVLGAGLAGYFLRPDGAAERWEYVHGGSYLNGGPMQTVPLPYRLRRERPRVAVLIDNGVASSGEAVAISFKRRPDTRFFGTPTCGLSTSIVGYRLDDGAMLGLAIAVMADRERTPYGDTVEPDDVAAEPGDAVQRAVAWLRGR